MSAKLELRWLNINKTKGAAKRFAEFCKEDIKDQSNQGGFHLDKYQDAVRLIIRKLDNTHSIEKIFSAEEESKQQIEEKAKDAN